MPLIKITQAGWAGFTGEIGQTLFEDGVSVEPVNRRVIAIIGASLSIVEVDEDGVEGVNPALQHQMLTDGSMTMKAEVIAPLARATEDAVEQSSGAADPAQVVFHTKAELEEIAEKKGIHGLRAIMEPLNVKAASINKAIQVILTEELKLKTRMEAEGQLPRQDAAQSQTETPNEVIEDGEGEGSEGGEGGENAEQTDGEQPKDGESTEEPKGSQGDAGPGSDDANKAA